MSFPQLRSGILNPLAAGLVAGAFVLAAEVGTYDVAGTTATLKADYKIAASAGSYTWTATAATIRKGVIVAATSGSNEETGTDQRVKGIEQVGGVDPKPEGDFVLGCGDFAALVLAC